MINKYGVKHCTELDWVIDKMKETGIKNGHYIDDKFKTDFDIYRRKVDNITKKYKEELFKIWNGNDYYDNQYIRDNINLHYNDNGYPTIDHKISILYGYLNKIDPFIIGDINNLCITKRSINISKNRLTESQFIDKLNLFY
jgi:hypothetical protein